MTRGERGFAVGFLHVGGGGGLVDSCLGKGQGLRKFALAQHRGREGGIGLGREERDIKGAVVDEDDVADESVGLAIAEDRVGIQIARTPIGAVDVVGTNEYRAGDGGRYGRGGGTDDLAETGEELLAGDVEVRKVHAGIAVVVKPAVGVGMLREVGASELEALSPVAVGIGEGAIGMGGAAEELIGISEEVRIAMQRGEEAEEKERRDGDPREG